MTTAADIVGDAALAAGIGDLYNPLDASQSALALRVVNRLLASWSTEALIIYNNAQDTFTMTAGQASYSTSLLNARPVEVTHTFVSQNGVDFWCDLMGPEDYAKISYKATNGLPNKCYFNNGMPQGTLEYFPTPSTAYTASVGYRAALTSLATLTTVLSLPPGYERAMVFGLACDIASSFGAEPTPSMVENAKQSKHAIKVPNYSLDESQVGIPTSKGLFNIYRGTSG